MKFRKKPVVIEAVQWMGPSLDAVAEISQFAGRAIVFDLDHYPMIHTKEGVLKASPGDWIIKGVAGEFYPCKPDIFDLTYEAVDDD